MQELPKQFEPQLAEERWLKIWEENGCFHAEPNSNKKPYTIVIPPPNVTGALHLGHALNNTLQDAQIRMHRMMGFETLWMPGTDHAGIATQAMVEKRLKEEENLTRHELGREGLVSRIWAWKDSYEKRITTQLKRMGASCDWRRQRFTLDERCAKAVRYTFFTFFQKDLIYRGKKLVNWDTNLQTAVSDDEVFSETVQGHFWYMKYPVVNPKPGEPEYVTVATTRPETMLGDTAVAVHPNPAKIYDALEAQWTKDLAEAPEKEKPEIEAKLADLAKRRVELLPLLTTLAEMAKDGRMVMLPIQNREIPLVADIWAKPELGTGAVKITPAHDPNDYEVGRRCKLPMINILNKDGSLNANAGKYEGQTIYQARENVVAELEQIGVLLKVEDREIELPMSDRSKTPIEPFLSDQWFVRMDQLSQSAMDAVIDGRVKIHPERYAKGYLDWLSEKRDWPIGRQLWWGHQIPIWYCEDCPEEELKAAFAGRTDVIWKHDDANNQWWICVQEGTLDANAVPGHTLVQDQDVLDTWFSSALWPHSTMGWPDATPELAKFYPTDLLITSRDIITLWVARMVLTSLQNCNTVPFHDVFIHPKILDKFGDTMSKSKGNGVDPLDVVDKFGADALRFGMAWLTTENQDVRLPVDFECPYCGARVEQTRENRVRPRVKCPKCKEYFRTQWAKSEEDLALKRGAVISERFEMGRNFSNKLWNACRFVQMNMEGYTPGLVEESSLTLEDRWLLSRLSTVAQEFTQNLLTFKYSDAIRVLYGFAWDEYCSFYVEMVKARLNNPDQRATAQRVLVYALDVITRLLHPIMPYVTEEIWAVLNDCAPVRGIVDQQTPAQFACVAQWPELPKEWQNGEVESQFAVFQDVLRGIREIRSRQNVPPKNTVQFALKCTAELKGLLEPMSAYFASMAGAEMTSCGPDAQFPDLASNYAAADWEVSMDLTGLIDIEAELKKQEKELAKLEGFIKGKQAKLSNEAFVSKAPATVIEKEKQSLQDLIDQKTAVEQSIAKLKK